MFLIAIPWIHFAVGITTYQDCKYLNYNQENKHSSSQFLRFSKRFYFLCRHKLLQSRGNYADCGLNGQFLLSS